MKTEQEITEVIGKVLIDLSTTVTPNELAYTQGFVAGLRWVLSDDVTVSENETGGEEK